MIRPVFDLAFSVAVSGEQALRTLFQIGLIFLNIALEANTNSVHFFCTLTEGGRARAGNFSGQNSRYSALRVYVTSILGHLLHTALRHISGDISVAKVRCQCE